MMILMLLCVYLQSMDQQNTELVYKITSEVSMHCGNNPLVVSMPERNEVCYCGLYQAADNRTLALFNFLTFPLMNMMNTRMHDSQLSYHWYSYLMLSHFIYTVGIPHAGVCCSV